ncbi:hypothetical protein HDU76_005147 [Blyttiomyces sp. JEL0837]|nr:hypothetical protein HDU76_005147 [Blyttiomyces sp. JEL0837]
MSVSVVSTVACRSPSSSLYFDDQIDLFGNDMFEGNTALPCDCGDLCQQTPNCVMKSTQPDPKKFTWFIGATNPVPGALLRNDSSNWGEVSFIVSTFSECKDKCYARPRLSNGLGCHFMTIEQLNSSSYNCTLQSGDAVVPGTHSQLVFNGRPENVTGSNSQSSASNSSSSSISIIAGATIGGLILAGAIILGIYLISRQSKQPQQRDDLGKFNDPNNSNYLKSNSATTLPPPVGRVSSITSAACSGGYTSGYQQMQSPAMQQQYSSGQYPAGNWGQQQWGQQALHDGSPVVGPSSGSIYNPSPGSVYYGAGSPPPGMFMTPQGPLPMSMASLETPFLGSSLGLNMNYGSPIAVPIASGCPAQSVGMQTNYGPYGGYNPGFNSNIPGGAFQPGSLPVLTEMPQFEEPAWMDQHDEKRPIGSVSDSGEEGNLFPPHSGWNYNPPAYSTMSVAAGGYRQYRDSLSSAGEKVGAGRGGVVVASPNQEPGAVPVAGSEVSGAHARVLAAGQQQQQPQQQPQQPQPQPPARQESQAGGIRPALETQTPSINVAPPTISTTKDTSTSSSNLNVQMKTLQQQSSEVRESVLTLRESVVDVAGRRDLGAVRGVGTANDEISNIKGRLAQNQGQLGKVDMTEHEHGQSAAAGSGSHADMNALGELVGNHMISSDQFEKLRQA